MGKEPASTEEKAGPKDQWSRENFDKHLETTQKYIDKMKMLARHKVRGAAKIVKILEPFEKTIGNVKFVEKVGDTGTELVVQVAKAAKDSRAGIDAYISQREPGAEYGDGAPNLAVREVGGIQAILGSKSGSIVDNLKDQAMTKYSNSSDELHDKINEFIYRVKHHEFKTIARDAMSFFIDHW